jgi:hypothetical protein
MNNRAPPAMDGMLRTVARGDRRRAAENQQLHLRCFPAPDGGCICMNHTDRPERKPVTATDEAYLRVLVARAGVQQASADLLIK